MFQHLLNREREERIIRPNHYMRTGPQHPPEGEHGTWVAMMTVKAG